uniref:F-box domain-containing protein n=1 Tax=Rhabditophanes sp. KR3021 TaxID=114890 RepID=A0AC35TGI1_9BILA
MKGTLLSDLPDNVLNKISTFLPIKDRFAFERTNHRIRFTTCKWTNIQGVEIYAREYTPILKEYTKMSQLQKIKHKLLPFCPPNNINYTLLLHTDKLKTIKISSYIFNPRDAGIVLTKFMNKLTKLKSLTIVGNCINPHYLAWLKNIGDNIRNLTLWDCQDYFVTDNTKRKAATALFSLPNLTGLVMLSTSKMMYPDYNVANYLLNGSIVKNMSPKIKTLHLTGVFVSVKAMEIICERLKDSLERITMGSTCGVQKRHFQYVEALMKLKAIKDIDFPPYLFCLGQTNNVEDSIAELIAKPCLKKIGFRHYNSSILYLFIEYNLPSNIRMLKVFHSPHRIPDFSELGKGYLVKKCSTISKESRETVMGNYRNSLTNGKTLNPFKESPELQKILDEIRAEQSVNNLRETESLNSDVETRSIDSSTKANCVSLAKMKLSIIAIEENPIQRRRNEYKRFSGVNVCFTQSRPQNQRMTGIMFGALRDDRIFRYGVFDSKKTEEIEGDIVRIYMIQEYTKKQHLVEEEYEYRFMKLQHDEEKRKRKMRKRRRFEVEEKAFFQNEEYYEDAEDGDEEVEEEDLIIENNNKPVVRFNLNDQN